jgi:hypothetical protein
MENKETLEEVLERVFDIYSTYTSLGEDVYEYTMDKEDFKEASLEIAKWQAERMYNGKAPETLEMLKKVVKYYHIYESDILDEAKQLIKEATEI